jgi:hypothetical protein
MADKVHHATGKKPQDDKARETPLAMVTSEHKRITNSTEAREFLAGLAKAPAGVRLTQRLRTEDGTKEIYVWEALSLSVMTSYLAAQFKGAHVTGHVGYGPPPPVQITEVLLFSDITPGGAVIVGGVNFNTYKAGKSKFLLVGGIQNGQVGAFQSPILVGNLPALEVGITQWGDSFAAGFIPGPVEITGVLDQPAFLQIVTAAGKSSNLWPVSFRAIRGAPIEIPGTAFSTVNCAGGGTCYTNISDSSVGGFHGGGFINTGGSGTDKYSCQLQNQFTYDHYEWAIEDGVNGGPFGGNPDPTGLAEIDLEISWFYNGGLETSSLYALSVFAVGPQGLTGW